MSVRAWVVSLLLIALVVAAAVAYYCWRLDLHAG